MASATLLDNAINQHIFNFKAGGARAPTGALQMMTAPTGVLPFGPLPGPGFAMHPGMLATGQPPPPMGMPPPMLPPGALPPPPGMPPGQPFPLMATMMPPLGPPGSIPGCLLSVAIDNLPFRYSLSDADIRETFQRWGRLTSVQVLRDGPRDVALVTFEDPIDAGDAQQQLHGFPCVLEGAPGVLNVVRGPPDQLATPAMPRPGVVGREASPMGQLPPMAPPPAQAASPCQGTGGASPAPAAAQQPMGQPNAGAMPKAATPGPGAVAPSGVAAGVGGQPPRPAWCCKIVVQAEMLHPEFPIVVKILGDNNANVEHLRSQNQCTVALRGRGSRQLEADGQELQEPMFLWIASDNVQNGKSALEMSQDLLGSVYEEHQAWCTQHGLPNQVKSGPVVVENPEVIPGCAPTA